MGWSRTERIIGAILALVGGFFFITCSGQVWLFQVPYLLVTGWFGFLQRVLPEVTLNRNAIAETVGVVVVLGLGTHLFLSGMWRRMYPHDVWPVSWSASVVGLLVLLFGATMATVGIGHHVGWLRSSRIPMVESPRRFVMMAQQQDNETLCYEALRWAESGVADVEVVQILMRKPDMREALERLHVVRLRGSQGEPGFIVFPRDPALRKDRGGTRCGGGLSRAEPVHGAQVPRLLPDGNAISSRAQ
jgi:hypothetical protein